MLYKLYYATLLCGSLFNLIELIRADKYSIYISYLDKNNTNKVGDPVLKSSI